MGGFFSPSFLIRCSLLSCFEQSLGVVCFVIIFETIMSDQEQTTFEQEVEVLKKRWTNPRFRGIVRPYTAEQVVSKRGTLPINYPSDVVGKKLWNLLNQHFKNGTPSHTYGALDPVQVSQMAKHLETVYVSGWQ